MGTFIFAQDATTKETKQEETKPGEALQKGVGFLLRSQSEDGYWHSEYYGNLKGGAGVSTLALYAISLSPEATWKTKKKSLQTCIDQLAKNVARHGYVANEDGPDYSNYGSAYLLMATRHKELKLDSKTRFKLIEYLLRSQLDQDEKYDSTSDDFGGWDLSGWMKGPRRTTGTNISVTATVLEALLGEYEALKTEPANDAEKKLLAGIKRAFEQAQVWIEKCSNEDGGFHFHPEKKHQGNKAGWPEQKLDQPRSYGSATADGIRCMLCLASIADDTDDQRKGSKNYWQAKISKSSKWIAKQGKPIRVPGFEDGENPGSWAQGLKYYYWMSLALSAKKRKSAAMLKSDQEHAFFRLIMKAQSQKGFWQNKNARMREDDPLIATSFALIALSRHDDYLDTLE